MQAGLRHKRGRGVGLARCDNFANARDPPTRSGWFAFLPPSSFSFFSALWGTNDMTRPSSSIIHHHSSLLPLHTHMYACRTRYPLPLPFPSSSPPKPKHLLSAVLCLWPRYFLLKQKRQFMPPYVCPRPRPGFAFAFASHNDRGTPFLRASIFYAPQPIFRRDGTEKGVYNSISGGGGRFAPLCAFSFGGERIP